MFKDLVLWRQPVGSKLKIGDIRCQDLTSFGRFGVLMIDPPWENQASSSPTRGLTIKYPTLAEKELFNISFGELVEDGIVGLWVTNNKIDVGRKLMSNQGFRLVEYVIWSKRTKNGYQHSSQGQYLRNSKEIMLVGIKGSPVLAKQRSSDVIVSTVLQQSRKPREAYEVLERLNPGVRKLEIFGRYWGCRKGWWTFAAPFDWEKGVK
eukprot:snap_masked-scaffold_56-processed-gene-0.14-mRNA-1 protein AED:0.31 eAED:0.31 QI:0/-1/0/1/-1/1/1/0/206